MPRLPRSAWLSLLGVSLLAGFLFFTRLGAVGLFDADEPAFAVAAREMRESGDWVTPTFNGQPRFDKPVLFYYLVVLAYAAFGVNEFAARFWPALAGVCLAVLLWCLEDRHARGGMRTAVLAFLLSPLTWVAGRYAVTDMVMVLFLTGCLALAHTALTAREAGARRHAWLGAAACSALAVLVKGPIGLVLPGLILLAHAMLTGRLGPALRGPGLLPGALVFLALVLPWYLLVLRKEGWAFVEAFFLKHHLRRYITGVSGHEQPFWFYVPVLCMAFFPWAAFLPGAIARAARRCGGPAAREGADDWETFCLVWFSVTFLFFSAGQTKLPTYLLPAFPALAFLVRGWIEDPATPRRAWRRAAVLLAGLGLPLAVGCAAVPWILRAAAPRVPALAEMPHAGWAPGLLAVLFAAGTATGAVAAWGARRRLAVGALAGMMLLLAAALMQWVVPLAHAVLQGPLETLVLAVRERLLPGDTVVVYGFNAPSVVFYAGRRVVKVERGDREGLRRELSPPRRAFVLVRARDRADLGGLSGVFPLAQRGDYGVYLFDLGR
ncbi:MAG TPA: glycosyltransferase family 39 protein [Candidatus Methylomirabilis sp.]